MQIRIQGDYEGGQVLMCHAGHTGLDPVSAFPASAIKCRLWNKFRVTFWYAEFRVTE